MTTTTMPIPKSDLEVPLGRNRNSLKSFRNASIGRDDSLTMEPEENSDDDDGPGETMTMSLMDLLEETDRQAGIEGETYRFDDEDEEEEDDEEMEEEDEEMNEGEVGCCLCMVKHKGSGLVPCGHTYCRMCSREMWVQKGHCPVCSDFVSEILEIF